MRAVLRQRSIAAAGWTLALSLGAGLSVATTSAGAAAAQVSARPTAASQSLATTVQPTADCTIYSGSPTSSANCGGGSDDLVGDDGNGNLYRTMISFPAGLGIPAGSHILSSTLTIAYQPPGSPTTAPTPPVVTTPVSTPVPTPAARRSLKIKLVLSWTWNRATTRLHGLKVGSLPGDTGLSMTCRGRGCPRHSKTSVTGARAVRRTLRSLAGRRYRAGDVLTIRLSAPGYRPEQAEVVFRAGKLPSIRPLRRS
jgi:hypothetical protein